MHQDDLPVEAIGEDEIQRPQPADEPISVVDSQDLYRVMRNTIDRLERERDTFIQRLELYKTRVAGIS